MQKGIAKKPEQTLLGVVIRLLKGGLLAVGTAVLVLFVTAALMSVGALDRGAAEYSVIVACVLGTLAGGLYANKRDSRAKLLVGIGVGAFALLFLLAVGGIFFGALTGAGEMRSVGIGCVCGGLLSGVLSAVRRGGKKRGR